MWEMTVRHRATGLKIRLNTTDCTYMCQIFGRYLALQRDRVKGRGRERKLIEFN